MPMSICLLCSARTHHNIGGSLADWYARWPGVPMSDPVPSRCLECFVALGPESRVVVRKDPRSLEAEAHKGQAGTIKRIHLDPASSLELLFVQLDDGPLLPLIRADVARELET